MLWLGVVVFVSEVLGVALKFDRVPVKSLKPAEGGRRKSELLPLLVALKGLPEGEALTVPVSGDVVRFRARLVAFLGRQGLTVGTMPGQVAVVRLVGAVAVYMVPPKAAAK